MLNNYWAMAVGRGTTPFSSAMFAGLGVLLLPVRILVELSLAGTITVPILYWTIWRWIYRPLKIRFRRWMRARGVQTPLWVTQTRGWVVWFFYGSREEI